VVIFRQRQVRPQTVLNLLYAGNLEAALPSSEALYRAYPDKVDVALVRCRSLVAAGRWVQSFNSIVPFAGSHEMEQVNLFVCLTSAHLGNVLSGEQEYCANYVTRYVDYTGLYVGTIQKSADATGFLAWAALGVESASHADDRDAVAFYSAAWRLDPGNPLIACLLTTCDPRYDPGPPFLKRAKWLGPLLAEALPRATGKMHEKILNEMQKCESTVEQAAKPGRG